MSKFDFLTAKEQEKYLHLLFCIQSLSYANKLFKEIEQSEEQPLIQAAFGYALMQYAVSFSDSFTKENQKLKLLPTDYIPECFVQLHNEIMEERNRIHAHMDLALFNPKLHEIEKKDGVVYSTYASNSIMRFNKISKIAEIVRLVDIVIENLHKKCNIKQQEVLNEAMNRKQL